MSITLTAKSFFLNHHILGRQTNEGLMLRYAKSGDKVLLSKLYDSCGDDLYHFVLTLSSPQVASDICQKTWLKVIEKKHLYRNSGQFKSWLFTLARNLVIDDYRLTKSATNCIDDLSDNEMQLELLEKSDTNRLFDQALLNLPFAQKEAFCLQQEGFSLHDISKITHTGEETVKTRLRYAKKHLRAALASYSRYAESAEHKNV